MRNLQQAAKRAIARSVHTETGCLEYTGSRDFDGYAKGKVDGQYVRLSRVMWSVVNGEWPPPGFVLHRCDNPPCIEPNHVYVGDNGRNMMDRALRGRHSDKQLTPADVRTIRAMKREGQSAAAIARALRRNYDTVKDVTNGRSWAWLP